MQFRVIGTREGAGEQTLTIDAVDAMAARLAAAATGIAVIDVAPAGGWLPAFMRARGPQFDLDLFCQELLSLMSAGIPIGEALETLSAKDRRGGGQGIVAALLARIREGRPLSRALAERPDVFPILLTESLRAAEQTSDYGPALQRFVRYRKLSREVRAKLMSASTYPLILLAVSTCVLLFLVGYVVPRFAEVYRDMGDRLPAASRVLLAIGQWVGGHPTVAVSGLALLVVIVTLVFRSAAARARAVQLAARLPRLRDILAAAEFARLYRTLALLVHGGIPLVQSLDMVRGLLPPHLAPALDACRRSVAEGKPFASSMAEQKLSSVVADRFFRVGERTGSLAEMMDRAADFHEEEVARGADLVGRLVGPVLMLAMGLLIGFVVVLMYMPIFELADAIQ